MAWEWELNGGGPEGNGRKQYSQPRGQSDHCSERESTSYTQPSTFLPFLPAVTVGCNARWRARSSNTGLPRLSGGKSFDRRWCKYELGLGQGGGSLSDADGVTSGEGPALIGEKSRVLNVTIPRTIPYYSVIPYYTHHGDHTLP